jgi:hypothetical protein
VKEMPKTKTKSRAKPVAKTKGQESYETGVNLENRVAKWLSSQFGYNCKKRVLFRGKVSKRPYEIDVHAQLKKFWGQNDLWVECKAHRVKRTHITKLVETAIDVKDACEDGIEELYPDMLMLVSNKGFDVDAIQMADKYCIYCVNAGKTFEFVGKMDREDFEDREESEY